MEPTTKLPLHKVVPMWTLPDKHGDQFSLAKVRGRKHLLLLIFGPGSDPAAYLTNLAKHTFDWNQLPARGIVIVADADTAGALGALPFTILIDEQGKARDLYLTEGAQAGVFALDRYADLYQQWLVSDLANLPSPVHLNGWLQAIAMQCSI
jgi:peroxiredoxin